MANQLPPAGVQSSHHDGSHLSRVQDEGGHAGPRGRINHILTMQMEDVSVEAHVVQVPDNVVVDAHFECRHISVDVAIQLQFIRISVMLKTVTFGKQSQNESATEKLTGKKFGAIAGVTLVFGVLMNCGYQMLWLLTPRETCGY
jgi:hypothetical protein